MGERDWTDDAAGAIAGGCCLVVLLLMAILFGVGFALGQQIVRGLLG